MCQSPSLAVEHRSAFDSALTVHTACQLCHCSKDLSVQEAHRKLYSFQERTRKAVFKQLLSTESFHLEQVGVVHRDYISQSPNPQQEVVIHGNPSNQQRGRPEILPSPWISQSSFLKTNIPLYIYWVTCPDALSTRSDNTSLSLLLLLVCYLSHKYCLSILLVGVWIIYKKKGNFHFCVYVLHLFPKSEYSACKVCRHVGPFPQMVSRNFITIHEKQEKNLLGGPKVDLQAWWLKKMKLFYLKSEYIHSVNHCLTINPRSFQSCFLL